MRSRSPAVHARHYLTLVARAYATAGGDAAPPPAARTNFLTLYKPAVGVKVQAWFRRHTPSRVPELRVPELRVGVVFDAHDAATNARRSDAFAARFAAELRALGAEDWPSETGLDRRLMTALPVAGGSDVNRVSTDAAALAGRFARLLDRMYGSDLTRNPCETFPRFSASGHLVRRASRDAPAARG